MEQYYTSKYIAKKLSVSLRTVERWISTGKLKAVKIDNSVRIANSEIQKLLKGETE